MWSCPPPDRAPLVYWPTVWPHRERGPPRPRVGPLPASQQPGSGPQHQHLALSSSPIAQIPALTSSAAAVGLTEARPGMCQPACLGAPDPSAPPGESSGLCLQQPGDEGGPSPAPLDAAVGERAGGCCFLEGASVAAGVTRSRQQECVTGLRGWAVPLRTERERLEHGRLSQGHRWLRPAPGPGGGGRQGEGGGDAVGQPQVPGPDASASL